MIALKHSQRIASRNNQTAMVLNLPKRYYELQRLHFYDQGGRNSISGVRATVFGNSSPLGVVVGGTLTSMGSQCIYPYRNLGTTWDARFRELKVTGDLGYKTYMRLGDFTSQKEIEYTFKESNVVICMIGNKIFSRWDKDFEEANIKIPMTIAKAVRNSNKVQRFIYVSAAGADPNSHSRRLRTKWIGEQEVKEIFPDVTILRPTLMFNTLHPNMTMAGKWGTMLKMFNQMNFVIEGMDSKCQPVFANDVAIAALNCLKMEETIGESYDLGGPHTYTYREMYEMFFNYSLVKPYSAEVKLELAYEYYHYKWFQSVYRQFFRQWLFPEFMTMEAQDLVCNPDNKGFEDLKIKPISFGQKCHEYVQEIYQLHNIHETTKRENANN